MKKRIIKLSLDLLFVAVLVWFDQFTKALAVEKLMNKNAYVIVDKVFELLYLENRGAAFGMMQNKQYIFAITGIIMLVLVLYVLIKIPINKRYILGELCVLFIASGAIGNMIDRFSQGYVVDFFYFVLINFPIFNVADIYVTVSCVVLAILILFVYSDSELSFLAFKKKNDANEIREEKIDEKI